MTRPTPMSVELSAEGGFGGRVRRWTLSTEQLPGPLAARLSSLLAAAWTVLVAQGPGGPFGPSGGFGTDTEPDDASAQTTPARDRQAWTLTCMRGDEELTCRMADGERLPEPVAALMRFVRETERG